jgi:hypothetical protein
MWNDTGALLRGIAVVMVFGKACVGISLARFKSERVEDCGVHHSTEHAPHLSMPNHGLAQQEQLPIPA